MSDQIEPGEDEGTGRGIDAIGKRKIKTGMAISAGGAIGGGVTGVTAIQVAIEQGWLSPLMPSEQPATFGLIIAAATWLWSTGIVVAKKYFGKFPKQNQ